MKPQGNDKYPDSGKPLRSQRIGVPESDPVVNNRLTLVLRRGTWKFQSVVVTTGAVAPPYPYSFFAVTRLTAIDQFPVGVNQQTAKGEIFSTYVYTVAAASPPGGWMQVGDTVEVDILDGENLCIFSQQDGLTIKYVQVGELPPRDPEVSDRER